MSARLQAVAEAIPVGARVADVGTDHGRLLVRAVRDRDAALAIGIDLRALPLREAARTIATASPGIAAKIELRCGDGLAPLGIDEVDTIVIGGMGGQRIVEVLAAHPDHITTTTRLVLQPATDWAALRRWLADARLEPRSEQIVWERGRPHLVLAVQGRPWTWDDDDVDFGPCLRRGETSGYRAWLAAEHARLHALATCSEATARWRARVDAECDRINRDAAAAAPRGPRPGDR